MVRSVACVVAVVLLLCGWGAPASAAGPDGPALVHRGDWYLRTSPSGGPAQSAFRYGTGGDLPVMGDWDGDGRETVGVVRTLPGGGYRWLLRNSNSAGPAEVSFDYGAQRIVTGDRLGSIPVAGNFDPSDAAAEVGIVYVEPNGSLTWAIRGERRFSFGRATDRPIWGDWDGDGADTPGVVRDGNRWLLSDARGGSASRAFTFGSPAGDLPVPGDWNGDGVDTPGVVRNDPPSQGNGGYDIWLVRNSSTSGPADRSFRFGSDALAPDLPLENVPRLRFRA
ncbi:hypothetical protein [Cryptosporangium sp. NPDC051539]|uniref:hypothetical protein n=1 Tax=Cryptosporangium sp. NPDC051539 TaxID=3363962 RepID=UPI003794A59B